MKIIKLKKLKNEIYEITFEDNKIIKLYEDIIIKYNLLNKDIDEEMYHQIIDDNNVFNIKYLAIKFIEKKLRSEKETREFLKNKVSLEQSDVIIKDLKKLNLLNDLLFAKAYTKDKYNINKYGKNKIINGLYDHDIDDIIINEVISFITDEEELNRIEKIIDKYIKTNKNLPLIKLKNKIYSNLIDRGYDQNLIYIKLNDIKINDDALIKNYNKLYKKYSIKYNEEELINIIKKELLKFGFSYEDIKKIGNL